MNEILNVTLFELQGRAVSVLETAVGGAGAVLVVLLVLMIAMVASQRRRARDAAVLDAQLTYMARAQSELTGRLQALAEAASSGQSEIKRSLDERLDQVSHRLGQSLTESARRTGENLTQLNERLAVIDTAQRNITELSSKVVGLQEILANKQARGAYGQGRMEAIVADGLPGGSYSFQYTLSNGKRPDCVVTMPDCDQVVVIDSKFPLEGFTAVREARDAAQKRIAETQVRTDVGRHIGDVAARYRLPGEVQDTLIMFVPSESIYAELYEKFDDLIQKAYRARVIIVSPNMLMLAVQTMQAIMRDAHMRQQTGIIQAEVVRLVDDVGRLSERVLDLKKHFGQANQDIDRIEVSAQKINNRGRKIETLDLEDEAKPSTRSAPKRVATSRATPKRVAGGRAA